MPPLRQSAGVGSSFWLYCLDAVCKWFVLQRPPPRALSLTDGKTYKRVFEPVYGPCLLLCRVAQDTPVLGLCGQHDTMLSTPCSLWRPSASERAECTMLAGVLIVRVISPSAMWA